jgi:acyl carrier protein
MSVQTTETLSRQVIDIISKQMNLPKEQVSLDSQFIADLGYDSLDLVEFGMDVEEELNIVMPDEVGDSIHTVRDAVEAIQKLIT